MADHPAIRIRSANDGLPIIEYAVGEHRSTIELIPRSDATLAVWCYGHGDGVTVVDDRKLAGGKATAKELNAARDVFEVVERDTV